MYNFHYPYSAGNNSPNLCRVCVNPEDRVTQRTLKYIDIESELSLSPGGLFPSPNSYHSPVPHTIVTGMEKYQVQNMP